MSKKIDSIFLAESYWRCQHTDKEMTLVKSVKYPNNFNIIALCDICLFNLMSNPDMPLADYYKLFTLVLFERYEDMPDFLKRQHDLKKIEQGLKENSKVFLDIEHELRRLYSKYKVEWRD